VTPRPHVSTRKRPAALEPGRATRESDHSHVVAPRIPVIAQTGQRLRVGAPGRDSSRTRSKRYRYRRGSGPVHNLELVHPEPAPLGMGRPVP
jgi:hypothetical protein